MDLGLERLEAIVLAGGKGTRLRSVVGDRPKPLAPVAGRPFVEWLLLALRAQGVRRVVLSTGYKGEMVEAAFGDGARLGLDIAYAREPEPRGTGGGVRHALPLVASDRVLVLNGDSFCPFDLHRLVEAHERAGAAATLLLVPMPDCRRYGAVEVADDGHVRSFVEKSPALGAGMINGGVYLFGRATLEAIPVDQFVSLEQDVFPSLIGVGLCAVAGSGPFLDIGTPESYAMAEGFLIDHQSLLISDL